MANLAVLPQEITDQSQTDGISPVNRLGYKIPPGRRCQMVKGLKLKKGQTGVYLSVSCKTLLVNISASTGLTMSMVVETALREYAFNHRDELKFYSNLMGEQKGHF